MVQNYFQAKIQQLSSILLILIFLLLINFTASYFYLLIPISIGFT
jgi:hypothetical protein